MALRTYAEDANLTVFVSHCTYVRAKHNCYIFNKNYRKVLEVEDQLLCPVMQEQAGDDYDKLKTTFECFQEKLRQVTLQVKQRRMKNMRQLTLHDMRQKYYSTRYFVMLQFVTACTYIFV